MNIVAGTSTGSTPFAPLGPVGDSPFPGCGVYANDAQGCCSCTGYWEAILVEGLGAKTAERLPKMPAMTACKEAIKNFANSPRHVGGVICIKKENGKYGLFHNTMHMPFAFLKENVTIEAQHKMNGYSALICVNSQRWRGVFDFSEYITHLLATCFEVELRRLCEVCGFTVEVKGEENSIAIALCLHNAGTENFSTIMVEKVVWNDSCHMVTELHYHCCLICFLVYVCWLIISFLSEPGTFPRDILLTISSVINVISYCSSQVI